ncbi:LysR family transcriptional regulator [Thermanaerothrix sp.]|jgi:DNA-binding transcriptional LysR family regulator|uniref:LysR family transcriptional regulator n=1 Tax=Thermanaerothrix sp. TaxID=2972675 RepID=UPI002ADD402A|nr:LysR family transcriptional regulator [Thermanaerothrix sp.]
MLSLHKLDVFMTVAEEGSISRAAERLYMTQAAVSQHIHDLEAGLGVVLFERHAHGVRLSPAGERLLTYARQILWLTAAAESELTQVSNLKEGEVRLGVTPGAAAHLLTEWLLAFHERFPHLKATVYTEITPALVNNVLRRRLDLALVEGEVEPEPHLRIAELGDTYLVVVVGSNHPWAGRETISIYELARQPFLVRQRGSHTHEWVLGLFSRFGLTPHIVAEFNDPHALRQAIIHGLGVSLLPACLVRDDEQQGRLSLLTLEEAPDLRRALKVLWRTDWPPGPVARAFLRLLAERYPHVHVPDLDASATPFGPA